LQANFGVTSGKGNIIIFYLVIIID